MYTTTHTHSRARTLKHTSKSKSKSNCKSYRHKGTDNDTFQMIACAFGAHWNESLTENRTNNIYYIESNEHTES